MKQICPLHHFFFNGNNCPFCEQERIERLSQKFDKNTSEAKKIKHMKSQKMIWKN